MLAAILTAVMLLTPNPVYGAKDQPRASDDPGAHHAQATVIKAYCSAYALKWNVRPEYVMAVAHIESRKGSHEFRIGRSGRYWLPMGIHNCFLKDRGWPVDTLPGNIEIGARALRNIQTLDALHKRLRKYNAECNPSYLAAVTKAVKKYEKGW